MRNTAQLPQVELETSPKALFGANTADSLHSGIVNGTAAMLDGMAARFAGELGAPEAPVIATGSLPPKHPRRLPHPHSATATTLILDGLFAIWQRNARR